MVIKKEDPLSPEDKALKAAMLSVYIKHDKERPTVCFICLGSEALSLNTRVYSFGSSSNLSKHFKRKHLSNIKEGQPLGMQCL